MSGTKILTTHHGCLTTIGRVQLSPDIHRERDNAFLTRTTSPPIRTTSDTLKPGHPQEPILREPRGKSPPSNTTTSSQLCADSSRSALPNPMAPATTAIRILTPHAPFRHLPLPARGLSRVELATPSRFQPQRLPPLLLQPPPSSRRALTSFLSSLLPGATSSPLDPHVRPPRPHTLHARRILPYTPAQLFAIIADIDSYRFFLPNCTASQVTAWTSPSPVSLAAQPEEQQQQRWPALADLTVGWGPFTQSYTSRVYCIPGSVVEAVSGTAQTTIPASVLAQAGYGVLGAIEGEGKSTLSNNGASGASTTGIFESLVTRWTVRAAPPPGTGRGSGSGSGSGSMQTLSAELIGEEWTEVALSIQFRFANPALGFAVGQLADEKVDEMVQAFQDRARRLYGTKKTD